MSDTLVIIGAGDHAKVCYEIARLMNKWKNYIILDDNLENDFFEVAGPITNFVDFPKANFFVAIGNNNFRKKMIYKINQKSFALATLIHPSAVISPTVEINKGTVVMAQVVINAASTIGSGVILNTSCTVDHDNVIGDYVHISPGTNLAGNIKVGDNTWIGLNSSINQNVEISTDITIGSGTTVIDNLYEKGTYIGTPAKRLKTLL